MTLREQIHDDVAEVFLQTDDFGETFYYLPKDGTRREIVGVVCGERSEVIETSTGEMLQKMLQLFVSRDSSDGIDSPKVGDALWRKSEGTTPRNAWSFSRQVEDGDEHDGVAYAGEDNAYVLLFVRNVPVSHGGYASA